MKHKWHKEIKAWADGAEIEYDRGDSIWIETVDPIWHNDVKYRIKQQPKEPQYLYVFQTNEGIELGIANSITRVKTLNAKFKYIGKIKLEVDDD